MGSETTQYGYHDTASFLFSVALHSRCKRGRRQRRIVLVIKKIRMVHAVTSLVDQRLCKYESVLFQ